LHLPPGRYDSAGFRYGHTFSRHEPFRQDSANIHDSETSESDTFEPLSQHFRLKQPWSVRSPSLAYRAGAGRYGGLWCFW